MVTIDRVPVAAAGDFGGVGRAAPGRLPSGAPVAVCWSARMRGWAVARSIRRWVVPRGDAIAPGWNLAGRCV